MERKRLLYADNDHNYLDARSELLERAGYEVIKAYSPDQAEQILQRENIHLMILDIRLVDDNDEGDISGILLAKDERYSRIPKIFVTGFPTFEAVREAYGPIVGGDPIAYAFLSKKEGINALIEAVHSAFNKVVGINWELRIVWNKMGLLSFPYLVLLLENSLDANLLGSRASELGDLFRKIFSANEQISIVRINWLEEGLVCLTLFALSEGSSRQAIAIVGHGDIVNIKYKRAEEYLAKEPGQVGKLDFKQSIRYAGFAYSIPDTGEPPLEIGPSFFQKATDKSTRIALENLFTHTLHGWHQHERSEASMVDLATIYRDRLAIHNIRESLEEARSKARALADKTMSYALVKGISLESQTIEFVFNNGEILRGPNPISALVNPNAFHEQPAVITSTFGGITVGSLLMDEEGRVYPTDMPPIIRSHILEDFASTECEFHFEMITSSDLFTLWEFENQLGKSNSLNDQLPIGNVEPECRKALVAIQTIRRMAAEVSGESLEAFLVGLFHYAIKPLLLYDPRRYLAKYEVARLAHRLLASSLILTQLEGLMVGVDETRVETIKEGGLKINEVNREVIVDGREVRLTQTEFKLLLFLFNNPNRLCSREEILSDVFEIKGSPTVSDQGLLNTHADRLRRKIDINPARHRYLVTIRGEGYLLDLKA